MALTAEQIEDMQNDLGIDDSEAVFTDEALDRLYARAGDDYNTAVYLAWRQLYASATAYYDYKVALTEEKRSQVFDHIQKMVAFWGAESRVAGNQLAILGLTQVPPRWKEVPSETLDERRRRERSYR